MNDRQITANIGLFYVCYMFSRYGWNAMPTIRNAKGADIFVVSHDGRKKFGIQVKTLSGQADVFIGKNYADPSVDFWVVLMNVRKDVPNVYIIPAEDVCDGVDACNKGINSGGNLVYSDAPKDDGGMACYLNAKFLKNADHDYTDAWERISTAA